MEALKNRRRESRSYNGNPLAFFRANFDLYGGMKRTALSKFDPGMYRALGRAGQLEEAIPEANELYVEIGRKLGKGELGLSSKDIETIIRAYKPYKGNASEASRHLPYNVSIIWRYWRNEGLKAQGRGDLSESEVKKVIKAHKTYEGNATKASRHLPYNMSTIWRYWRNEGLKAQGRGDLSESEVKKVIKAHKTYEGNAAEASKSLPHSPPTIIKYWRKVGLETRKRGRPKKH